MRINKFFTDSIQVEVKSIPITAPTTAAKKFWIKVSGVWKEATTYVKVGGVWKLVNTVYLKVNNIWR